MNKFVYGQNPDVDKIPNWTKPRIWRNPERKKSCIGQIPKLDKIPIGQNPKWKKSRTGKIQNLTNFKDRESQD